MPKHEDPFKDFVKRDRTEQMILRIKADPSFSLPDETAPYGRYKGRPIIGHDSPINGGVYVGQHHREAIVVDDKKFPTLNQVYKELEMDIASKELTAEKDLLQKNN